MKNKTIKRKLTREDFELLCQCKGITNTLEISRRWDNYLMFLSNGHFDRTASEVGANINPKDFEDED